MHNRVTKEFLREIQDWLRPAFGRFLLSVLTFRSFRRGPAILLIGVFLSQGAIPLLAAVNVTLSETKPTVTAGAPKTFTATVAGSRDSTVAWSSSPIPGLVNRSGIFTAPDAAGTYTVIAQPTRTFTPAPPTPPMAHAASMPVISAPTSLLASPGGDGKVPPITDGTANSAGSSAAALLTLASGSSQIANRLVNKAVGASTNQTVSHSDNTVVDLPPGCVLYYPMNEGEGSLLFDNSGLNTSTAVFAYGAAWCAGYEGTGASFNQGSSLASLVPSIPLGDAWTISTWFLIPLSSNSSMNNVLISGNNNNYYIGTSSYSYKLEVQTPSGSFDSGFSLNSLSNGWHHLVAVCSGGVLNFYVDGAQAGNACPWQSGGAFDTIGNINYQWYRLPQPFGTIDDFRYYRRALSQIEITTLYLAPSIVVTPPNPVVAPNSTLAFGATTSGNPAPDYTWTVVEPGGGSIDASGMYTAPATMGVYHVAATSNQSSTIVGTTSVDVIAPPWDAEFYLPLNQGAGSTLIDSSGLNTSLTTLINGPLWNAQGPGLNFTNTAYVSLAPAINLGSAWTVSTWFLSPLPNTGTWHKLTSGGNGEYQILVHPNQVSLGADAANTGWSDTGFRMDTLAPGWHHLAVVGTNTSATFFMDGIQAGNPALWYSGGTLNDIGNEPGQAYPFGLIDEFHFHQRALAPAEIAQLAAGPHIEAFKASDTNIPLGGSTTCTCFFAGGVATIDHGVGAVLSGVPITLNPSSTTTYTLTVTNVAGAAVSSSFTVNVVPGVNWPTISAPLAVTANWPGFTAFVTPQAGCTFAWTISSGSITSGVGASAIQFTPGTQGNLSLTCTVTNALGTGAVSSTRTIQVLAAPSQPVISTATSLSPGLQNIHATVQPQVGMTYQWTVSGGSFITPSDSNQVSYNVGSSGTLELGCTIFNAAGSFLSQAIAIPVASLPTALITASDAVCSGTIGLYASVPAQTGASYSWTISGGTLVTSSTGNCVTFSAGAPGSITLQCTVTLPGGQSATGQKAVTVLNDLYYAYYSFDENQGVIAQDHTGHGFMGLLANGPQWVPGKSLSALHFGGNSYVSIPKVNCFSAPFSISAWVQFDAVSRGVDNGIIGSGSANTDHGLSFVERNGHLYFGFYGDDLAGSQSLNPGVWYHVAAVYDGANKYLYVNGVLDTSGSSGNFLDATGNAWIGGIPWETASTFSGVIDEVRIWNQALTASKVANEYASKVNIVLSPRTVTIGTGQSTPFHALVSGNANPALTWVLPDPNSGTLTQAGVYTAPSGVPTTGAKFRVVAQSEADPTQSDTVWVTVNPAVAVFPGTVTLPANGSTTFQVAVTGPPSQVVWSVQEMGGGSITSSGLYSAPSQPGTYHVLATSPSLPSQPGVATVQVGTPIGSGLSSGLVGFWNFDGLGNPLIDATGNGNDGVPFGGTIPVPGKVGNGMHFNGQSAGIALPTINMFTGTFTIAAWVKFDTVNRGNDNPIFGHGQASANMGLTLVERGGKPYFGFSGNDLQGNTALLANQWTHIVATYDGTSKAIYVNGALDSTQVSRSYMGVGTNAQLASISWANPKTYLEGILDEVKIYDRALSASEVGALYASGVNILVSPHSVALATGGTQNFTSQITDAAHGGVSWSLPEGPGSGALTSAGVYTAPTAIPPSGGTYHVMAQSLTDPSQADIATVTVQPSVRVLPAAASVLAGTTAVFSSLGPNGLPVNANWSIRESGGGSVSAGSNGSITYSAPSGQGVYHLVAAALDGTTSEATVTVTLPVSSGPIVYFPMNEGAGSTIYDGSGLNSAIGILENAPSWVSGYLGTGLSFPSYGTASLSPAIPLGHSWSISSWFQYPLPSTGTWHMLCHDLVGDSQIVVHPDQISLGTYCGNCGLFYASGFLMNSLTPGWHQVTAVGSNGVTQFFMDGQPVGKPISWQSVSSVYFIGNNGPGNNQAFGIIDEFKIYQRALAPLEISSQFASSISTIPSVATVSMGGTLALSANVVGASDASVTWSVEETGGGTIDSTGLYTAPLIPGVYHVFATSNANPALTSAAKVTVSQGWQVPDLYFNMDEGAGSSVTSAVGGLPTIASLANNPVWVPGKWLTGLSLPGNGEILLPAPFPLGNSWTISAWFLSPLPTIKNYHSLTRGQSYYYGDHQIIVSSDEVSLGCYQGYPGQFWDSGFRMNTLAPGWHHVAAVGAGTTTQFYMDGSPVGHSIPWQSNTDVTYIGNDLGGGMGFGTIDDFRIYLKPLISQDIAAMAGQAMEGLIVQPGQSVIPPGGSVQLSALVPGDPTNSVTWSVPAGSGIVTAGGVYSAPQVLPAGISAVPVTAQSTVRPGVTGQALVTVPALGTGLSGYWKFDEGVGSLVKDSSGNGHDGVIAGNVSWAQGRAGAAVSFDGSGGTIKLPAMSVFNSPFTVSAWVKFHQVNRGVDNPILGCGVPSTNNELILMERSGKPYFAFYGNDLTGNTSLAANLWNQLTFVFDGLQKNIYVNGVLDSTQASGPFLGAATNLELGQYPSASSPAQAGLDGILDEIRVYNRALSAGEVSALFKQIVNITVLPAQPVMGLGQSLQLAAAVTNASNGAVTWSLPDPSSGTITSSGLYTAPLSIPFTGVTYHVTATSVADPTQSCTIPVLVGYSLQVNPQLPTVVAMESLAFTATTSASTSASVTWSVQEPGGGSITSRGIYTAPATPGLFHVLAASTTTQGLAVSVPVTVTAPGPSAGAFPDLYLPFDEGMGLFTLDASGFNHTPGTLVNGPAWVKGKLGWGLAFNTPTARVTLSPPEPLGTVWTVAAWIQVPLPSTSAWHTLFRGGVGDHAVIVASDGVSLGTFETDNSKFWNSGFQLSSLNAGWHQLAAVGAGGTTQFYMDGQSVGALVPWQTVSDICSIGNYVDTSNPQAFGTVDDVRVYHRALGQSEIAGMFQSVVNVTVSPVASSVTPGQSQTFSAAVTGSSNTAVTWSILEAGGGSINSAGVYTPPASFPTTSTIYHVMATSVADPSQTATVPVTLSLPVVVTPAMAVVALNGTCAFAATTHGLDSAVVTWTSTGGSIDGQGNFTAPAAGGIYTITAKSVSNPNPVGTATVYVPMAIQVIPAQAGLLTGAGVAFEAIVRGTLNPGVDWSVWESGGGTISTSGFYTSPLVPGTYHVNASSQADPNSTGFAIVQVVKDVNYSLDPTYVQIQPGGQVAFQVVGPNSATSTVSWSSSPASGLVNASGVFTAPQGAGTYLVTALVTTDITRVITATVVVGTNVNLSVTLSPAELVLQPGNTGSFSAFVQGAGNSAVTWSATGGTVDGSGVYTAPGTPGTYLVRATAVEDGVTFGEATVVVEGQGIGEKTLQYDLNGNLMSDGTRTFEWDAENRLVAVVIAATGHRSEFGYDGFGRRICIRELDPDASQNLQVTSDNKYLWDGLEIVEKRTTDGGTVLQRYYTQGFVDTDGTALFYNRDHLGSIRELTDGTQTVQARFDYDSWGRMNQISGSRVSPFGYAGYFWHPQSGLDFTLYRAYDPSLGRWISRDPIGEDGGINLYGFVLNNPINWIDFTGLQVCPGKPLFRPGHEPWNDPNFWHPKPFPLPPGLKPPYPPPLPHFEPDLPFLKPPSPMPLPVFTPDWEPGDPWNTAGDQLASGLWNSKGPIFAPVVPIPGRPPIVP